MHTTDAWILTLSCPDRPGIVHAVTGFLVEREGNVTEAAQFHDASTGLFFMRVRFDLAGTTLERLGAEFAPLASRLGLVHELHPAGRRVPTVILVSKLGHCLADLLFRHRAGALPIDVRAVVSNHRDFERLVAAYDLPFHHVPVVADAKADAEAALLSIVDGTAAELVVLARYMQVLSNDLCRRLEGRAINIHHSFLPSFKGARPYHQAAERGVKIIGATAHYVTAELDEGPIIEQDTTRVDHTMDPAALTAAGRDVESSVLARAVLWHAERRVLVDGRKTVVFR